MQKMHARPGATSGSNWDGGKVQRCGGPTLQASEILAGREGDLPVWVRPPKSGLEPYTGLTRSKLYQLAAARKIETRSLREHGRVRGVRLFLLRSILDYINSFPADSETVGGAQ